jgi:hypothetical protein
LGDLNAKPEKFETKRSEIDSAIPTTPCLERDYLDSSSLASPGFQYMGGGGICLLIFFLLFSLQYFDISFYFIIGNFLSRGLGLRRIGIVVWSHGEQRWVGQWIQSFSRP